MMVGIDMPMPYSCFVGKDKECPLLDDNKDCKLQPDSRSMETLSEQFDKCPLIDLSKYEDDLK